MKLLALAPGHRLHREQAMDVLWGDRDPASAANNLNQAVHVARRALGAEAIEVRDETLRLVADVDVDRFEARGARGAAGRDAGRIPRGARAVRRGAAPGEPVRRLGRPGGATELDAAVCRDRGGARRAAARRSGVAPELPAEASSFVGREHELGELRALLARTRLLTLDGAGRRRQDAARARARPRRRGLVRGRRGARGARGRPRRRGASPGAVGRRARRPRAARTGRCSRRSSTSSRRGRLLLVLDNCEHVLAAAAAARRHAPPRGDRPDDRGDEPRAAPRPRRGRVPRPVARDPGPGAAARARGRCCASRRCGSSSSGPRPPRRSFALDARERGRRGAHLLPPRRASARARARGRAARRARAGGDRRAARRPVPPAPRRRRAAPDAPADARGDAPVEPRPARARRAGAAAPARRLRRRLRARRGRGGLRGRRARAGRRRRHARTAGREVARSGRRGGRPAPLPAARDSARCTRR